jgi:hypothetical protein
MQIRWLVPACVILALCGCGKSSNPIGAGPTLNSLSIVPATDLIMIQGTETFSSTATYSNGSTGVVQSTWSSDAPSVATVDASTGRATGIGAGQATIVARYSNIQATRLLRVVPDYHGQWTGDWAVTACSSDGDWQQMNVCQTVYATGSLWALAFVANQTRDAVSGTIDFGDNLPGPVTGTIAMNGHLTVSGTYAVVTEGISVEVTVSNWDTTSTDNMRMTGHFRLTLRMGGIQGSVSTDGDLRIVAKGTTPTAITPGGIVHALGRRATHR